MENSNKQTAYLVLQFIIITITLSLFARPENVAQAKLEMKEYTDSVIIQAVNDLKKHIDQRFTDQEKLFREIAKANK